MPVSDGWFARWQAVACLLLLPLILPASAQSLGLAIVGANIEPTDRFGATRVVTFTQVTPPGADRNAPCPEQDRQTLTLSSSSWVGVVLSVPYDQMALYKEWLERPSEATIAASNGELLSRLARAYGEGIDKLGGAMLARPQQVDFVIYTSPSNCSFRMKVVHESAQAAKRLTFPIAVHDPGLLDDKTGDTLIQYISEVIAHELVHVVQLHPFGPGQLRRIRQSRPFNLPNERMPMSLELELRARMIDRCLRQATMPGDWNDERLGQMWRDDRSQYRRWLQGDPYRPLHDELFARQFRILKERMVDTRADADLRPLFGHCAMYMQRPGLIPLKAKPNTSELRNGLAALEAIRGITEPILFRNQIYNEVR